MSYSVIRKRRDFLAAFASGKKFVTHSFILQTVERSKDHPEAPTLVRVGFTVTKKMGNAVTRNRIKRRLREAVKTALLTHGKPGHDYVIISRHKAENCPFSDLERDMEFAFRRIIHHKSSSSQPKTPSA